MIGSQTKGKGFGGTLRYLLEARKEEGKLVPRDPGSAWIIGGTMEGETAAELTSEFGVIRKIRPTLKRAVYHVSLALPPAERLTDEKWAEIADRYVIGMGFGDNQYVAIRHSDTDHDHIHIVANRIQMDGAVVSDSNDFRRSARLIQTIEKDLHLSQGALTPEEAAKLDRRPARRGEVERGESSKADLKDLVGIAAEGSPTMTDFVDRLEKVGVGVRANIQKSGRIAGISYSLGGVFVKGSSLGKAYAWKGIQTKLGVQYVQDRDLQRVKQATERAADQGISRGDREDRAEGVRERGSNGPGASTPRSGDREVERRDARDPRSTQDPDGSGGKALQIRDGGDHGDLGTDQKAVALGEMEALGDRTGSPDPDVSGYQRVVDLASPLIPVPEERRTGDAQRLVESGLRGDESPGDGHIPSDARRNEKTDLVGVRKGPAPALKTFNTASIAMQHVRAMGVSDFEFGIRDQRSGKMLLREWGIDQVEGAIPWLRRMNALGNDIYVRPAKSEGVILLDDLKQSALDQMVRDGLGPAAIVETSPDNYQAWVRLHESAIVGPDIGTEAAKILADRYGGDPNSADWRHFGRLSGFTNRKPAHRMPDGRSPFVRLISWSGRVAERGLELLETVVRAFRERKIQVEFKKRVDQVIAERDDPTACFIDRHRNIGRNEAADTYAEKAGEILRSNSHQAWSRNPDWSRMDYMVGSALAIEGYGVDEITESIREGSPRLSDRKDGHLQDYLDRTVKAVFDNPDVQRMSRGPDHSRGPSM